jgi:hypothetical protein
MLSKTLRSCIKVRPSILGMTSHKSFASLNDPPKRVAVTGAAGNISYSVLFRIASGEFLGPNQRVILHLVDLPFAE